MARIRRKADLPEKVCARCGRPFAWRKKWARDWESVRYCSERCRREAKGAGTASADEPPASADAPADRAGAAAGSLRRPRPRSAAR